MVSKSARSETPRRRLSADEARERILVAAERHLAEVGPEGLRLTDLAAELGVSHPAILHHFGSREGLVVAVVGRAVSNLNRQLVEAIARNPGRAEILDMVADFFSQQGTARTIAWLVLSNRIGKLPDRPSGEPVLQTLIEEGHRRRVASRPDDEIELADSRFRTQLTALALLGDALFGDLIRFASGEPGGPEKSKEFRRRLAKLLNDTI